MNSTNAPVYVIVPTYNRVGTTLQCIDRLRKSPGNNIIYICDSASNDGTAETVASIPGIILVNTGQNAWWSASINAGIKMAFADGAEKVIIMNDDIVFDDSLLLELLEVHDRNPTSIVTPIQQTGSGSYAGTIYKGIFKKPEILRGAPKDQVVHTSNGCCLLIPKIVIDKVGFIDETNCPHLYGDTEFQLRAQHAGFKTIVASNARIGQMGSTDYLARLYSQRIFSYEGSPLYIRAYLAYGRVLYNGTIPFILLGWSFHLDLIKVLAKILLLRASRLLLTLR
jgi:GT2 family glycosyltransferase